MRYRYIIRLTPKGARYYAAREYGTSLTVQVASGIRNNPGIAAKIRHILLRRTIEETIWGAPITSRSRAEEIARRVEGAIAYIAGRVGRDGWPTVIVEREPLTNRAPRRRA